MNRLLLFLIFSFFFLFLPKAKATHVLGGEITWECLGSGKFIFKMKLYRACYQGSAGVSSSYSISNPLYAQYGGVSSIQVTNTNIPGGFDLALSCYDPLQTTPCGLPAPAGQNAMEEHVYTSQPVQINGIPDSSGSDFTWSLCCRPPAINISNQPSLWIRATMFPYTESGNTSPKTLGSMNAPSCYDGSPAFVARPLPVTCFGALTMMTLMASDLEGDSIIYEWTNPMQSAQNAVLWNSGYNSLNQFPTTFHHPNNIAASLDSSSGLVNFTTVGPTNAGYYNYAIKVSAYKKGQLVAQIYRDIPIIIFSCPPTNLVNSVPSLGFKDAGSNTYKTVLDTAIPVGTYIELDIQSIDLDTLTLPHPNNKQSITVEVVGEAQSTKPNNTTACNSAPCAFLDTVGNTDWNIGLQKFVDTSQVDIKLKWQTTCDLLYSSAPYEGKPQSSKFRFTISSQDNSCPVPARTYKVLYITVYDSVTKLTPIVNIDASQGGAFVEWNEYKGQNFLSYELMGSIEGNLPYVRVVQKFGISDTSFNDQFARTDTVSHSYFVRVNNQIGCESFSNLTKRSIYLEGISANQRVYLEWNRSTELTNINGFHSIYRKLGTSIWTQESKQPYTTLLAEKYSDLDSWQVYENYYRINAIDSKGHTAISNVALVERDTPAWWGIDEAYLPEVQFVPNPFRNELLLIDEDEGLNGETLKLYNILGEQVAEFTIDKPNYSMDLIGLKPGVYFIHYRDKNGNSGSKRLLKIE